MGALFLRGLPFVSVSGSASINAPISNLNLDEPGLVWRSSSLTSVFFIVDLGTATLSYDIVSLVGINLRSTDTIQIRTGATSTGIGAYAGTVKAAYSGTVPSNLTGKAIYQLGALRSERYMRIDITATGHPDGYVQAQRLVVGKAIETLGVDYDAEQTIFDPTVVTSAGGYDVFEGEAAARIRWKFSIGFVAASSWRDDWVNFLAGVGKRIPVLFVPNMETPASYQTDAIYGRIRNDPLAKSSGYAIRSIELVIESLGP